MLSHLRGVFVAVALAVLCACPAAADEYRGFWIDAWHAGFLSQAQVDNLLGVVGDPNSKGTIRDANCNSVFIQVRRNADACYPSGMGEPYFSGLSPAGFNALQAVIDAAHDTTGGKQRIDVHAWMVTFRTSGGAVYGLHDDQPTGSLTNLDNYWITRNDAGAEPSSKAFDPGHPLAEEYLTNVAMDLVTNFDIDGIHYDYIRFESHAEGYNPTSVARYNARYGLTGQPAASSAQWEQWRRDQVTAYVRKVYAKIQSVRPECKQSGSFVTWNPSPTASTHTAFQSTRPYYDVFSDWDSWMQEGIVDMAVPMNYYDQALLPADYLRWLNFMKDRKANRHVINGPGIYKDSLSNAILQILMTRDASPSGNYADGWNGYSYFAPFTYGGTSYGPWSEFAPELLAQVTQTPANIPTMPWKTAPTKGHISGTVTYLATGAWADGATVSITGPQSRSMVCDGTGFYAFIDLTPGTYTVTTSQPGYPNVVRTVVVGLGAVTGNMYINDVALGTAPPPIYSVEASNIAASSATITWLTTQPRNSQVEYGLTTGYGSVTVVDPALVTSHSVGLAGLAPHTTYHYRALSRDAGGNTVVSDDYTFTTNGPPVISGVASSGVGATSATITWTTNVPADGVVNYGTTTAYGQQIGAGPVATSHTATISGLSPNTQYHFQCVSANSFGSAESGDYTFATTAVPTEVVIDNTDPGWTNTSANGGWNSGSSSAVPKIGTNYLYRAGDGTTIESSQTRKCRWTPNLPVAGIYDVYVYYQIGSNRNPSAPYTVHYDGGQVVSVQNQYSITPNLGGWFLVGQDLPFAMGTGGYVELTTLSTSTANVSADAAKWVLKSAVDSIAPVIGSVAVSPSRAAASDMLMVTVSVTDNTGVTAVTADGVALTHTSGDVWSGVIPADDAVGPHAVSVVAGDAAYNSATSTAASYTTNRVMAASNGSLLSGAVTQSVSAAYLFKTWGLVTVSDASHFELADGSLVAVKVYCPGHGLVTGDFASAHGIWDTVSIPRTLNCQASQVRKLR